MRTRFASNSPSAISGVTLLELLLVMTIIAILACLLVPAVSKARATSDEKLWFAVSRKTSIEVYSRLVGYYASRTNYQPQSVNELVAAGVFDRRWLREFEKGRIQFLSFSPSDPTNKVVVRILLERDATGSMESFYTKGDILDPPEAWQWVL